MTVRIITLTKVPSVVMGLATAVNMTPIAWRVDPDSVTIVFEQGPKLTFDRASLATEPMSAQTTARAGASYPKGIEPPQVPALDPGVQVPALVPRVSGVPVARATGITLADGVNDQEAATAGKALAARKRSKKPSAPSS